MDINVFEFEDVLQKAKLLLLIGHPYPDPNVLISGKEMFLWCSVPKAASTSWKAYFIKHHSGKEVDGMDQIDQRIQPLMSSPRCEDIRWKKLTYLLARG